MNNHYMRMIVHILGSHIGFPVNDVSEFRVNHDGWCGYYSGKVCECNCIVTLPNGEEFEYRKVFAGLA